MNIQENIATLTQEDKVKYLNQINRFDLSRKTELMKLVPEKLKPPVPSTLDAVLAARL